MVSPSQARVYSEIRLTDFDTVKERNVSDVINSEIVSNALGI
jgi:hypothetical protein